MYKNIIFDLGGVMVEWQPQDFLMERFHNAATEKKVYSLTFGSVEWAALDAGRITRFAANQAMLEKGRLAGYGFEVQEVIDNWTDMLKTQHRVADVAAKLRQRGFSLYYLSNIPADVLELLQQRSFWRLFDGGVASCEVDLLKPQPEIYQTLLKKYSLLPKECIFIDDNEDNVRAAYEQGITGISMKGDVNGLIRNLGICGIKLR